MQDRIFRAYDIRGIVGTELLVENVYAIARALAFYCIEKNPSVKTIAVGMDGRTHSPVLKEELVRGLVDSGLNVIFIGRCATPVLYYSQHNLPVQAGVMITASHNPANYNGFKMVLDKKSIAQEGIQTIRDYFWQKKAVTPEQVGTVSDYDIIPDYVAYLKNKFPHLVGLDMPVVFDCAQGAAATVMPQLVEAFKWNNVQVLHTTIDGTFSCEEPDPSVAKNMELLQKAQLQMGAPLAIGFDGDADRMGALDEYGNLIVGDKLLGLFAQQVLQTHPGATVVFDAKCSDALVEWIQKLGGVAYPAKTGHSSIKAALAKTGAVLGGELSCHFFFSDRYFGFDDGIYAGLRLMELVYQSGTTVLQLLHNFPVRYSSPEIRITIPPSTSGAIIEKAHEYFSTKEGDISTLDGIRVECAYGWGLLRGSNTQPVICVRLESKTPEGLLLIKQDFIEALWYAGLDKTMLETSVTW